jgi:hypothetical protein
VCNTVVPVRQAHETNSMFGAPKRKQIFAGCVTYLWSPWKLVEYDPAWKEVTGAWEFAAGKDHTGEKNRVVKTWRDHMTKKRPPKISALKRSVNSYYSLIYVI